MHSNIEPTPEAAVNDVEPETHLRIDEELCGEPVDLDEGRAVVRMEATPRMAVDEYDLVHGGFVFGLADHAAMLAVNDPNVVLASAESEFTAPAQVGATLTATARIQDRDGAKFVVDASVSDGTDEVFRGTFTAFVPDRHVLEE